jgi:hypothetical protein
VAAAATAEPAAVAESPRTERSAARLFEPGGLTLEDRILGAWEDLAGEGAAECPVCGDRMPMLGGCRGCGSELS